MTILEEAQKLVFDERREQYGGIVDCLEYTARLWSAYLGVEITAVDVTQLNILQKMGRLKTGSAKRDNFTDEAGYAELGAVCAGVDNVSDKEIEPSSPISGNPFIMCTTCQSTYPEDELCPKCASKDAEETR